MAILNKTNNSYKRVIQNILLVVLYLLVTTAFCKISNYPLIIPILLLFFGLYLSFSGKGNTRLFLNLGLLLTLIVFTAHAVSQYTALPVYYIPVACAAMLTMLLFNDLELSFLMGIVCSIVVTLVLDGDFSMMSIFLLGSVTGAYSVREARRRDQLYSAGLFVGIIHVIALFLWNPDVIVIKNPNFEVFYLWPLASNGLISAFFVLATCWIFEYLFGVLTNLSLLELADFDQPLLKRMILEAPGTYQHSLVVSNMSEAAAASIGANSLLTRVGAYYHDIGKMIKPEYFTENQLMGGNKHDNIEPSMSRLVILNHVKEGLDLAKKHNLNPRIMDFISQHHGTSLMYYFYQKSLEDASNGEKVDEDSFRYPGPKPQSRETAINLLADSVEAATRSIDEPNLNKIEATVRKVINNKFIDGQLDDCNLTLRDIEKISSTFVRILSAMYHTRVKYPERQNGNSDKKPSEKNTTPKQEDNKDNKENPSS